MDAAQARRRFAASPVARLATADAAGRPHLVPITFCCRFGATVPDPVGDVVYSAVDAKPKSSRRLKRLANIAENPAVSLLADHYDGDWRRLWWVRADGIGEVLGGGPEFDDAVQALVAKYPQYRTMRPEGPVIAVRVRAWRGWAAATG